VKIASETGDKRKIFFCKTAFTAKLHVSRKQFSEEEKLTPHLNERRQYGYAVSNETCQMKTLDIVKELAIRGT
jgi:hypothetical protein